MSGSQVFALIVIFTVFSFILVMTRLSAGNAPKAARRCSQCGTDHPGLAHYCRVCGKKLQ